MQNKITQTNLIPNSLYILLRSAAGQAEPVPRAAPGDPPQLLALLHRAAPAQAQLQGEVVSSVYKYLVSIIYI